MSDTTQNPTPEQAAPAEGTPRPAGRSQPTFDEILAAAAAPKPPPQKTAPPPPRVSPPPAPPKIQAQPSIGVPTINLDGEADGVRPISRGVDPSAKKFTGFYERRILPMIGHNVPQEAPAETVAAIRALLKSTPR